MARQQQEVGLDEASTLRRLQRAPIVYGRDDKPWLHFLRQLRRHGRVELEYDRRGELVWRVPGIVP